MVLLDLSQVMVSNLMVQLGSHTNAPVEEAMLRHMVLNSIRSNKQKFCDEYGELVVACDSHRYWRRQFFPHYKANRKKSSEKSEIDWHSIFEYMSRIKDELKESFPYRVIDVEGAEADDVIATLVMKFGEESDFPVASESGGEKILILSGDKDFVQLHRYSNVRQYDPVRKRWISSEDPEKFLKEHVLNGDSSDGVPNVMSADDCFVREGDRRQSPLTKKNVALYCSMTRIELGRSQIARNYARNETLIDLRCAPESVSRSIVEKFEEQANKNRSKLVGYFMAHRLSYLMERVGEF